MNLTSLKHHLGASQADEGQAVMVYIPQYRRYFQIAATDVQHRGLVLIAEAAPTEVNFPQERKTNG